MPELPEVETIRRGLSRFILNKKIVQVRMLCEKSWIGAETVRCSSGPRPLGSSSRASGADACRSSALPSEHLTVSASKHFTPPIVKLIRRFGKALVIDLSDGQSLMIHLRMTGQLIWRGEENYAAGHPSENFVAELPNKQTRVIFEFEDGTLYFNDQRKFGFVKVLRTDEVEQDAFIKKLAKEPWQMTSGELYAGCQRHARAPIKAVLLDQGVICGLGNIYADEALYAAGVHPATRAGKLNETEVEQILVAAREVMDKSIASGGSTMATYVRADGTRGDYLERFAKVFRREGQPCERCGAEIEKIRVAGRGTHICPRCQKLK